MILILVRHGETIENTMGICQGQTEGTLSEKGIKENKILAEQLKTYKIDAIYSSPLQRAYHTAKEIQQYFPEIEIQTDSRLMEMNFGEMQGKKFPEDFNFFNTVNGQESVYDLNIRVNSFLSDLKERYKEQTVLAVSHGVTNRIFQAYFEKIALEDLRKTIKMQNSGFKIFEF